MSDKNVWQQLLAECTRGYVSADTNVIVAGGTGVGKGTVLGSIASLIGYDGLKHGNASSLDAYFASQATVRAVSIPKFSPSDAATSDLDDVASMVNFWLVNSPARFSLLDPMTKHARPENTSFVIVLDSAKPAGLEAELARWMRVIQEFSDNWRNRLSPETAQQLLDQQKQRLDCMSAGATATSDGDTTAQPSTSEAEHSANPSSPNPRMPVSPAHRVDANIGFPVTVVCAKAFALSPDPQFALQAAWDKHTDGARALRAARASAKDIVPLNSSQRDLVQAVLRTLCLRFGAALFSISAAEDIPRHKQKQAASSNRAHERRALFSDPQAEEEEGAGKAVSSTTTAGNTTMTSRLWQYLLWLGDSESYSYHYPPLLALTHELAIPAGFDSEAAFAHLKSGDDALPTLAAALPAEVKGHPEESAASHDSPSQSDSTKSGASGDASSAACDQFLARLEALQKTANDRIGSKTKATTDLAQAVQATLETTRRQHPALQTLGREESGVMSMGSGVSSGGGGAEGTIRPTAQARKITENSDSVRDFFKGLITKPAGKKVKGEASASGKERTMTDTAPSQ